MNKKYHIYKNWQHVEGHTVKQQLTKKPIQAHSELNAILRYKLSVCKKRFEYAKNIKYTGNAFYYGEKPSEFNILRLPLDNQMFYAKEY